MGNSEYEQNDKSFYLSGSQLFLTSSQYLSFESKFIYQRRYVPDTSSQYIIITRPLDLSHQSVKSYFQKLRIYDKFNIKNNLLFPLMCLQEEQPYQCCVFKIYKNTNIKFCYESFTINLSYELQTRQVKGQKFNQSEIWFIIYNILIGIQPFQPFSHKSGLLNTNQVYMNQNGEVRIKNILYSPYYYDQQMQYDCFDGYSAPQELQILTQNEMRFGRIDDQVYRNYGIIPNVCQIFSLGIIVISLTSLSNAEIFYNFHRMSVNFSNIDYAMQKTMSSGYSRLLTNFIKVMLSSYKDRPLPSQMLNFIKPYERSILHFLPFTLNSVSKKTAF